MSGKLIVISGPSGVGKSTVLKKVMDLTPNLYFSVSATTRPQRPGEADGVNYFFVSRERFQQILCRRDVGFVRRQRSLPEQEFVLYNRSYHMLPFIMCYFL